MILIDKITDEDLNEKGIEMINPRMRYGQVVESKKMKIQKMHLKEKYWKKLVVLSILLKN